MAPNDQDGPFPWHLGVFDSHCHPTDTMSSIKRISSMKARSLTIMATRSQDQDLVFSVAEKHGVKSSKIEDWKREECVVPAFGWHPWFSYQMYMQDEHGEGSSKEAENKEESKLLTEDQKITHYQSVLQPCPKDPTKEERRALLSMPDPQPFNKFLRETRKTLLRHPYALIGEIGLDRSFRIPESWIPENEAQRNSTLTPGGREGRRLSPYRVNLKHQKAIVKAQLQLAAELGRAVSMHGVQAHGAVFETIKELWVGHERKVLSKRERRKMGDGAKGGSEEKREPEETKDGKKKPYPPRICLHSYSGDASTIKQYLNPAIPVEMFFSFSTAINLSDLESRDDSTPQDFVELVKGIPDHMLLVESDLHVAGEDMDQRLEDIVRRICGIKGWALEEGVKQLGKNWRRFVFGEDAEGGGPAE